MLFSPVLAAVYIPYTYLHTYTIVVVVAVVVVVVVVVVVIIVLSYYYYVHNNHLKTLVGLYRINIL